MLSSSVSKIIPKFTPASSLLLLCDMQEKFRPLIHAFPRIISNSNRLLGALSTLHVPALATEQYPKGLGRTVPELELNKYGVPSPFSKTQFSMFVPEVKDFIDKNRISTLILCGIEGHACILQTGIEALESGHELLIPVDCVSSRSVLDRKYALETLKNLGGTLTTSETIILGFLKDSSHPKFKQVQSFIMEPTLDI